MKRSIIPASIVASCVMAFFMMSSFKTISTSSVSNAQALDPGIPITIIGSSPVGQPGPVYTGTVVMTGAINATGTFEMPTELHGMALHCTFELTLPDGNITIRMNCNMVTFNGAWTILGGTGAYQNLKGGGKLVMPNDTDEILTGTVRGI